ncbi:MAG TPA: hypothetical protein VGC56_07215 [Allosphingosinicella sp.]|jgi:hypothetical protein
MAESGEFPPIEALAGSNVALDPYASRILEKWRTLSPELQQMVPHIAQLIVEGMGGSAAWRDMNGAKRNIMSYTAAALLAEARQRARHRSPISARRSRATLS